MLATRVWAWKRCLHRVPRGRHAVADASRAAMSRTSTAAMSCSYTGAAANSASASMSRSYTGTAANSATCSRACSASGAATSATATSATSATATSATTAVSEQRTGRCEQQCRYGDYRNKLGCPRHDDPLSAFIPRATPGNAIAPTMITFEVMSHSVLNGDEARRQMERPIGVAKRSQETRTRARRIPHRELGR